MSKFLIAWILRSCYELVSRKHRIHLSWKQYIRQIAPAGIASSLDIGISNWSFEFITVSLYTMTKSSSIIFILFFSLVFNLEKKRVSLIFVVLFIATGLFMFTYKSTQFNLEGFLLVLLASFISGIRWTLAQVVTQKTELGLSNPIDVMFHMQPWMLLSLLPLSVSMESIEVASTNQFFRCDDIFILLENFFVLLAGALLAFCLEYSEFLLISHTSSLALSIAGIFKEICTLYLAAVINGDQMNSVNIIGLCVCIAGISLHVFMKASYSKELPASSRHH